MRKYLVLLWLLLPLPFVVLHYGRGQQWLARDQANDLVRKAWSAEQKNDWKTADSLYREAARLAAKDQPQLRLGLDLAQVRTRFRMGEAVTAIDMAERLVNDPAMTAAPQALQREARDLSARIHYYAAWVMRLEGANRELWMEEAELARQNFRLLAAQGPAKAANRESPPAEIRKSRENLESAVQLQRLSLTELMARPLPEEGRSMTGQGLSEQMAKRRGQRGKGKQPGRGQGESNDPSKGAGMQRFDPGSGS